MPAASNMCMQFTARSLRSMTHVYRSSGMSICYKALADISYCKQSTISHEWMNGKNQSTSFIFGFAENFENFHFIFGLTICLNRKHTDTKKIITNFRCEYISIRNVIAFTQKNENEMKRNVNDSLTLQLFLCRELRHEAKTSKFEFYFRIAAVFRSHSECG